MDTHVIIGLIHNSGMGSQLKRNLRQGLAASSHSLRKALGMLSFLPCINCVKSDMQYRSIGEVEQKRRRNDSRDLHA